MRTLGFLFLVVLSLASCKKSNPADATPAENTATTTTVAPTEQRVPEFSSPEVDQYAATYDDLLKEYKKCLDEKNMDCLTKLGEKFSTIAAEGNAMVEKAGAEGVKLSAIIKSKTEEFTALSKGQTK